MKLQKSPAGKVLIILYYAVFGVGIFILMMVLISKIGILAGLAIGLALSVVCGIIGGELEFIEHNNMRRKKYGGKKKPEEPDKIIAFPGKKT